MCPLLTVPPVLNNCWVTSVCAAVCIAWPALLPGPLHRLTRIASRPLAILCRTATELDRDTHIERRRCEYIHPICGYVGGWEYNRCESRRLGRKHHSSTGLNATSLAGGVARTSKSTALSASELVPYRILSNPLFSEIKVSKFVNCDIFNTKRLLWQYRIDESKWLSLVRCNFKTSTDRATILGSPQEQDQQVSSFYGLMRNHQTYARGTCIITGPFKSSTC